jgi:hypothetical protein
VLAGVERFDGKGSVLVEEVGQDDGIHVVLEELVVVGVGGDVVFLTDFVELFFPDIAKGDELHAHVLAGA